MEGGRRLCTPTSSSLPQLQTLLVQVKVPLQVLPGQQGLPFLPHAHSHPSAATPLQSAKLGAQVMKPHAPAVHIAATTFKAETEQSVAHVPQCLMFVMRSLSQPSFLSPSQSTKPVAHAVYVQVAPAHVAPEAFFTETLQLLPQLPQWSGSATTSMSQPVSPLVQWAKPGSQLHPQVAPMHEGVPCDVLVHCVMSQVGPPSPATESGTQIARAASQVHPTTHGHGRFVGSRAS